MWYGGRKVYITPAMGGSSVCHFNWLEKKRPAFRTNSKIHRFFCPFLPVIHIPTLNIYIRHISIFDRQSFPRKNTLLQK